MDGDAEIATQSQPETTSIPKVDDDRIPPVPVPAGPPLRQRAKVDKVH